MYTLHIYRVLLISPFFCSDVFLEHILHWKSQNGPAVEHACEVESEGAGEAEREGPSDVAEEGQGD